MYVLSQQSFRGWFVLETVQSIGIFTPENKGEPPARSVTDHRPRQRGRAPRFHSDNIFKIRVPRSTKLHAEHQKHASMIRMDGSSQHIRAMQTIPNFILPVRTPESLFFLYPVAKEGTSINVRSSQPSAAGTSDWIATVRAQQVRTERGFSEARTTGVLTYRDAFVGNKEQKPNKYRTFCILRPNCRWGRPRAACPHPSESARSKPASKS